MKSGYAGVGKHKNLWRARITVDGTQIHLGEFTSLDDAIAVRKHAEVKYGVRPQSCRKGAPPTTRRQRDVLPSREYLHSQFEYDPLTGLLWWRTRAKGRVFHAPAGHVAWNGYVFVTLDSVLYRAHRIIWCMQTGNWPKVEIDHEDGNRSNNKWRNLAHVTSTGNSRNTRLMSTNTSGTAGVHWCKRDKYWHATIKVRGQLIWLGQYKQLSDAVAARKRAEETYGFHLNHGSNDRPRYAREYTAAK